MVDGSIECLFVFTLGSSEYQMSFIDISVPVSQFHELLWEDENMYAGVNLPSFHHAADGWGNIANCFVVCSSITKFGVTACQYDTGSTTFPRWENYLRWKHKAAENWINISPKLLVLNWIALICLLRRLFVAALLLRRWHAGLWPIDRGLHIAEMYIRYALWLQPETMYLRCLHSSYIYLIVIRFSESLDNNMIQKCIITMQYLQYDI